MIRGLYTATSGMVSQSKIINVLSNNIANAQTTGFKEDALLTTSFGEAMKLRLERDALAAPVGATVSGKDVSQVYTSFEQGALQETGRTLDLAIAGEGFFTLEQGDGSIALTRNGQFLLSGDGFLTDALGNRVLGENGPLQIGQADFLVDNSGDISVNGQRFDRLQITRPADYAALVKQEGGLFVDLNAGQGAMEFAGSVKQGVLEASNVDVTRAMTDIIASSRAFQSCSQIVKMTDQILQKSVNELGKAY